MVQNQERKRLSAQVTEEFGVLLAFLDPRLKARERRHRVTLWSKRKALFFLLFASATLWSLMIAAVYFLYVAIRSLF